MLSTIHGRHILALFREKHTLSFPELKERFIETKEMNQTTLYRILERFVTEGVIHRAEFGWEKYFTLCQCENATQEAIELKCCINCHDIRESHHPLAPEAIKSETIELVRNCEKCHK